MSMESTESAITTTGDLPRKGGRAFETHPGLETIPGTLRTKDGARLRTIVTRPAGTRQRLPGVLFVQWLSCDSIELPESADIVESHGGVAQFLVVGIHGLRAREVKHGPKQHRRMAIRQHEAVAIGPDRILRIETHHAIPDGID